MKLGGAPPVGQFSFLPKESLTKLPSPTPYIGPLWAARSEQPAVKSIMGGGRAGKKVPKEVVDPLDPRAFPTAKKMQTIQAKQAPTSMQRKHMRRVSMMSLAVMLLQYSLGGGTAS